MTVNETMVKIPYDNPAYQSLLRGEYSIAELHGKIEFWERQANNWSKEAQNSTKEDWVKCCCEQANIYRTHIEGVKTLLKERVS